MVAHKMLPENRNQKTKSDNKFTAPPIHGRLHALVTGGDRLANINGIFEWNFQMIMAQ
jgi:hypothetical protein